MPSISNIVIKKLRETHETFRFWPIHSRNCNLMMKPYVNYGMDLSYYCAYIVIKVM